jgi:hypothetical protein
MAYTIRFEDERDFLLAASPIIGAAYTHAPDAMRRLNTGFPTRTFGKISSTHEPDQPNQPQSTRLSGSSDASTET